MNSIDKVNKMNEEPLFILYGKNHLRFFGITLLTVSSTLSFILVPYLGLVMIILGLYFLAMIVFVKFPILIVHSEQLEYIKKSILNRLTETWRYKLNDIKTIEFKKGQINWLMSIIKWSSMGSGVYFGSDQLADSDRLHITFHNNKTTSIPKFGRAEEFKDTIDIIKRNIKPSSQQQIISKPGDGGF